PFQEVGQTNDAGAVIVLYGSTSGLTTSQAQFLTQNTQGLPDTARVGDGFGFALAAGNLGNGGNADLAVWVPNETLAGVKWTGAADVLYGGASGLSGAHAQQFWQGSPGVADDPERFDFFGTPYVADFGRGS